MGSTMKRPGRPIVYHENNVEKVFSDASHQLRGLIVAYCYEKSEDPAEADLRWTDEVTAEMARVRRAVDKMLATLRAGVPGP